MERMKTKQRKTGRTKKVYRSIEEVREHFFPSFYEIEEERKKKQNPEVLEEGLAQPLLERIKHELRR